MNRMPLLSQSLGAAVGIRVMRVAAVDDDVALFEMRRQMRDHLVDRVAGLDHQHHAARLLQHLHQFLDRVRAHHLRAGGFVGDEVIHLRDGAIKNGYAIAVVVHVQNEVLAHYRETDEADITSFRLHDAPLGTKDYSNGEAARRGVPTEGNRSLTVAAQ